MFLKHVWTDKYPEMTPDGQYTADDLEELLKNSFRIKQKTSKALTIAVDTDNIKTLKESTALLSRLFPASANTSTLTLRSGQNIDCVRIDKISLILKPLRKTAGDRGPLIDKLTQSIVACLAEYGNPISIKIKSGKVYRACRAILASTKSMNDCVIVDEGKKNLIGIRFAPVYAREFAGWMAFNDDLIKHDEVQRFIQDCQSTFTNGMPKNTKVFRRIKDNLLKINSIYGKDTHAIVFGDPFLKRPMPTSDYYELSGTKGCVQKPEIPKGQFEPVLSVVYEEGCTQFNLSNARFLIKPAGSAGSFDREI